MRERCSTSEASAERPQEVVGRACAASSRPAKCRIWGWDQLPVHMRSGSVVVMSTVRKADPYLGFAEAAIYSEISVRAPDRRRTEGGWGH